MLSAEDLAAVWLTVQLAALTTVLLLVLGTPVAWWLARTNSRLKGLVGSVVTLPLVLPPAVLGFYLLVLLGPNGPVGRLTQALGAEGAEIDVHGRKIKVGVQPGVRDALAAQCPLGRFGTPEEAAGPIVFFCSPLSDYVTGEVLLCSGGSRV